MTKEEKKRIHNQKLSNIRMQNYRKRHEMKKFGADLERSLYDEITTYLKEIGITKKDFIIESYKKLRGNGDF